MYLLHGIFIRLPLAFTYFRILPTLFPALEWFQDLVDDEDNHYTGLLLNGVLCRFLVTVVWFVWLACLITVCRVWKDKFDPLVVRFCKWIEEIVVGRGDTEVNVAMGNTLVWVGEKLSSGPKRMLMASSAA